MPRKNRHLPVAFTAVELKDRLWAPRQRAVRERTVPFLYGQMVKIGTIEALDVTKPPGPLAFPYRKNNTSTSVMYWDSDIAKWIETASYTLATHPDPALEALIDEVVARIARAQEPDGYFNSFFQRREPAKKWSNLRDWHELYCIGHMIEAAVAHNQATGKTNLLDIVRRQVDLVAKLFGPNEGQKRGYCGHEEIELALVRLYRLTGERRYLDLASYFIDERGRQPHYFDSEARARGADPADYWYTTYHYNQSHVPVREQDRVVGHAVRAMYLYCAMADLAAEKEDTALLEACRRLWRDLNGKRLYVTGGLGPSEHNEGFTTDYDLPNETAYAETCASVGLVFWAHRMALLEGDGRYGDVLEQALYNNSLSGLSLDGERFFYDNPLASRGGHHRWTWHRCPCCPPNIARLIASLGSYVYSTAPGEADGASLRAERRPPAGRRRQGGDQADEQLSLGRRDRLRDRSRDRSGVHAAPAHPRLVPLGRAAASTARGSTSRPWPSAATPRSAGAGSAATRSRSASPCRSNGSTRIPTCRPIRAAWR